MLRLPLHRPRHHVPGGTRLRRAFVLSDEEILQLARWGAAIEQHYNQPMDIEWAKDGEQEALFIVQARKEAGSMKAYRLKEKGERLLSGLSIGQAVATGKACVIEQVDEAERQRASRV